MPSLIGAPVATPTRLLLRPMTSKSTNMSTLLDFSFSPPNRLITYLRTLSRAKSGLPHRQLVCVCASHTITSTNALLELAASIGPEIAILQIHADIIDDWSEETVRQLTLLAKRYGFLIWEGGQILNARVDAVGEPSKEAEKAAIDLIRKKYTRGVLKIASWAGIVTAWAPGADVNNQEADILIPTLRAAAREAVADAVQTVTTEITAGSAADNTPCSHNPVSSDIVQDTSSEYSADNSKVGLSSRKASTISLTHTFTQRTEHSAEHPLKPEIQEQSFNPKDGNQPFSGSSVDYFPPPPLLTRGLVLCLPSVNDSSFTPEYRQSCIAAAQANRDFVAGFLCSEPWDAISRRGDILEIEQLNFDRRGEHDMSSSDDYCLAIFSPLSNRVTELQPVNGELTADPDIEEYPNGKASPTAPANGNKPAEAFNPIATRLRSIVERAIEVKHSLDGADSENTFTSGLRLMHIPIITLP